MKDVEAVSNGCEAKWFVVFQTSERAIEIAEEDTFGSEVVAAKEVDRQIRHIQHSGESDGLYASIRQAEIQVKRSLERACVRTSGTVNDHWW